MREDEQNQTILGRSSVMNIRLMEKSFLTEKTVKKEFQKSPVQKVEFNKPLKVTKPNLTDEYDISISFTEKSFMNPEGGPKKREKSLLFTSKSKILRNVSDYFVEDLEDMIIIQDQENLDPNPTKFTKEAGLPLLEKLPPKKGLSSVCTRSDTFKNSTKL